MWKLLSGAVTVNCVSGRASSFNAGYHCAKRGQFTSRSSQAARGAKIFCASPSPRFSKDGSESKISQPPADLKVAAAKKVSNRPAKAGRALDLVCSPRPLPVCRWRLSALPKAIPRFAGRQRAAAVLPDPPTTAALRFVCSHPASQPDNLSAVCARTASASGEQNTLVKAVAWASAEIFCVPAKWICAIKSGCGSAALAINASKDRPIMADNVFTGLCVPKMAGICNFKRQLCRGVYLLYGLN